MNSNSPSASNANSPEHAPEFDLAAALGALQGEPNDEGLSLDELSRSYAAMQEGDDPYSLGDVAAGWDKSEESSQDAASLLDVAKAAGLSQEEAPVEVPSDQPDDGCAITPRSIWESILFVGQPGNQPVRARDVAKLMRGVTPAELDELVIELNQVYESEDAPYRIVSVGDGYRLELLPECRGVETRIHGKAKEAKLSQAHIETLAIVAYHQPLSANEVQERRGRPSASALRQLVRRGLLTVESGGGRGKEKYRTTSRFLQVFQLKGLSDLPQIQDLDRSL